MTFTLQPATYADIETLANISADAFKSDRHTQVKQLGRKPMGMVSVTRSVLHQSLPRKNCVYMKAVATETNETIGFCGWGFRMANHDLVPRVDPGTPPSNIPDNESTQTDAQELHDGEEDSIDRLKSLEDADMKRWMNILMPDKNTQCMYIQMFCVAPRFHGQGVGNLLAQWGVDVADTLGLFMWVHASEAVHGLLGKHGFETVGQLSIDLDEWVPRGPNYNESQHEKWGPYVLRYMKRLPRT